MQKVSKRLMQKVLISINSNSSTEGLEEVDAYVIGPFAVHISLTNSQNWDISHLKTGCRVLNKLRSVSEARILAGRLNRNSINRNICWNWGVLGSSNHDEVSTEDWSKLSELVSEIKLEIINNRTHPF